MEVSAAIAINVKAGFANISMVSAETGTAIGADLRTHPPTDVTFAVMNNLDSAVSCFHKAISISSQTREHDSHPAWIDIAGFFPRSKNSTRPSLWE